MGFLDRMMVVQYSRAKLTKYESCVIWNQWRLVHGTELYDVRADRAQKNDLIAKHPDIAKKMKDHYDKWWTDLEPLSAKFVATTIGSKMQPLTSLTSSDWQDLYTDNAGHVSEAAGGPRGGVWHIDVESEGEYEIALRRCTLLARSTHTCDQCLETSRRTPTTREEVAGPDIRKSHWRRYAEGRPHCKLRRAQRERRNGAAMSEETALRLSSQLKLSRRRRSQPQRRYTV